MYKLVILIESPEDPDAFEAQWPQFLHIAEQMPGLRQEITSRVSSALYGDYTCFLIHELLFDDRNAAYRALNSAQGQEAGRTLQEITQGRMTLLFADHHQDRLENIRMAAEGEDLPDDNADA